MPVWRRPFSSALAAILLAAATVAASAQPTSSASLQESSSAERPPIDDPAEVMSLPSDLKARLHAALGSEPAPARRRLDRLLRFIVDDNELGVRYRESATYSVAQTYATREANCVGFALLFLALAREAGLSARPQGIAHTLAWRQDDRTLYRSNHVNVGVAIGARTQTVDFAIEPVIARDPPSPISDRRLLAHYYNNLAMESLADGRVAMAQRLMRIALDLDPDYAPHWSNAGVLNMRNGEIDAAERAYTRALALDPRESSALFNMASLARRTGDAEKEAEFKNRLARVQQQDPFHHFLLALAHEQAGDDARAIEHYAAAIRLHKKEHRFHAALARTYRRVDDIERASRALKRARALSKGPAREAYDSELNALTKGAQRNADLR